LSKVWIFACVRSMTSARRLRSSSAFFCSCNRRMKPPCAHLLPMYDEGRLDLWSCTKPNCPKTLCMRA
jgi:hypothetical protein